MSFACLDIETSWQRQITIIGVYREGEGTTQLVSPAFQADHVRDLLNGIDLLFTYNGSGFDLPVIERDLGVKIAPACRHRDLMWDCRKRKIRGGLKGAEKFLGIHRDTEGLTGLDAMNLWRSHQEGRTESLEILLRYNREDVENLAILAHKLGILEQLKERTKS
jgi:uncharacterized protein YprB with RNaseH-like and TPR domain